MSGWLGVDYTLFELFPRAVSPLVFQYLCDRFLFFRISGWLYYPALYALYDFNVIPMRVEASVAALQFHAASGCLPIHILPYFICLTAHMLSRSWFL